MVLTGRASTAPTLVNMLIQVNSLPEVVNGGSDEWIEDEHVCMRVHAKPRRNLFTPLRVAGAPPAKTLCNARITKGTFIDTGEIFPITDSWTARAVMHRPMPRLWVGTTQFIRIGDTVPESSISHLAAYVLQQGSRQTFSWPNARATIHHLPQHYGQVLLLAIQLLVLVLVLVPQKASSKRGSSVRMLKREHRSWKISKTTRFPGMRRVSVMSPCTSIKKWPR